MKSKNVLSALLLLFVAGSVLYMVMRETGGGDPPSPTPTPLTAVEPGLVVYFFDADFRCDTCEKLEAYTKHALEKHFASQLKSGEIAWQIRNTDRPENEHFVTDYALYSKSVVLVKMEDGKEVKSENLTRIWDLVYDKPAYIEYIRKSVQDLLETAS